LDQGLIVFEEFLLQYGIKKSPGSGRRINTDRPVLPKGLYWKGRVIWLSRVADGKHYNISTGTSDIELAAQFLANFDLKAFKGEQLGVITKPKVSFEQMANRYIEQGKLNGLRIRSLIRYQEVANNFMKFLDLRGINSDDAKNISPTLIDDYKVWRSSTPLNRKLNASPERPGADVRCASSRTLQLEMRGISAFFKLAVRLRLLDENPVERTRSIRVTTKLPVYLDETELKAFLKAATEIDSFSQQKFGTLIYQVLFTYLKTGMRLQELRHLEWSDIELKRGEIHIRQEKVMTFVQNIPLPAAAIKALQSMTPQSFEKLSVKERLSLLGRTRILTPKLLRTVKFDDFKLESGTLTQTCRVQWKPKSSGRVIPISQSLNTMLTQLPRASNLVFPDPVCGGLWRFEINRIVKVCGQRANINKSIHTHTLRHTFATHLRRQGVAIETIQKLLGHENIQHTMIYAHFSQQEAQTAIPKIEFF